MLKNPVFPGNPAGYTWVGPQNVPNATQLTNPVALNQIQGSQIIALDLTNTSTTSGGTYTSTYNFTAQNAGIGLLIVSMADSGNFGSFSATLNGVSVSGAQGGLGTANYFTLFGSINVPVGSNTLVIQLANVSNADNFFINGIFSITPAP